MLKKITISFVCIMLCGCGLWRRSSAPEENYYRYSGTQYSQPLNMVESTDYSQVDLGSAESFRVAMLLPLSGKVADMGQSMKNAATLAIGDINNNKLVVQFYDTKSTGSGARVAVENAINSGSDLILGPLLADEVSAVSSSAKSRGIPVISFSTSPAVLQDGVYTLGLLSDEQINRIVRYAAAQGRSRLAAVFPDNAGGMNMFKAAVKAARSSGMQFTKVGFYAPDSMDFTGLVTAMKGGFDTLLIPEYGNRLKAISSMFSYYDVAAPEVLFVGTSVWENSNLSKETELYGAVYPVMSLSRLNSFAQKYTDMFGERPGGLSIFAYDAVALASALANKDRSYLREAIARPDGYYGISGAFRLFADGKNEHALDVVKVTSGGKQVVETAPQKFYSYYADYDNQGTGGYFEMPTVYGKSAAAAQNILLNVQ